MMNGNSWPNGTRHAMSQDEHERWNARHYPGTRQLCGVCGYPTGRCEEDMLTADTGQIVCEECYRPSGGLY